MINVAEFFKGCDISSLSLNDLVLHCEKLSKEFIDDFYIKTLDINSQKFARFAIYDCDFSNIPKSSRWFYMRLAQLTNRFYRNIFIFSITKTESSHWLNSLEIEEIVL